MPKKYGVKEKDQVIAYILDLIFTGRLRSGDRVDRNDVAARLGVSRIPVQEAIVQLENDGVLSTQYHRGVYVERFDRSVIEEYHEVRGILNGIVSARLAANPTDEILEKLDRLLSNMRSAGDSRSFLEVAWEYRCAIYELYTGPRLSAAIRSLHTFIPASFWMSYPDLHGRVLPYYEEEVAAVHRRDPEAARASCIDRSHLMGEMLLAELTRRGVIAPAPTEGQGTAPSC